MRRQGWLSRWRGCGGIRVDGGGNGKASMVDGTLRAAMHVSFPGTSRSACRYGWLPKLYEAVQQDEELFTSDERAILALGLGNNMVKAIRFWGQVFGLLQVQRRLARNTELARRLLDADTGIDPYLEDPGSLWRLHWIVTAHAGLGGVGHDVP